MPQKLVHVELTDPRWFESADFYNDIARDKSFITTASMTPAGLKLIRQHLKQFAGTPAMEQRALEIGPGMVPHTIGMGYGHVYLVDNARSWQEWARENIEAAQQNLKKFPHLKIHPGTKLHWVHGDLRNLRAAGDLPLDERRRFDMTTLVEVLTHIHPDERERVLRDISRYTDKLVIFDRRSDKQGIERHPEYVDANATEVLLRELGFKPKLHKIGIDIYTKSGVVQEPYFVITARRRQKQESGGRKEKTGKRKRG